jgi:hypothetical protein
MMTGLPSKHLKTCNRHAPNAFPAGTDDVAMAFVHDNLDGYGICMILHK